MKGEDSSGMRDALHMRRQRDARSDVRVGGRQARKKKTEGSSNFNLPQ